MQGSIRGVLISFTFLKDCPVTVLRLFRNKEQRKKQANECNRKRRLSEKERKLASRIRSVPTR
jgi:hypothetical protein